jgi:hypothetical protein
MSPPPRLKRQGDNFPPHNRKVFFAFFAFFAFLAFCAFFALPWRAFRSKSFKRKGREALD